MPPRNYLSFFVGVSCEIVGVELATGFWLGRWVDLRGGPLLDEEGARPGGAAVDLNGPHIHPFAGREILQVP
jgi:hypothetical protein